MAADEADIVPERQELLGDRLDKRGVAAAGQVGAPDRAVEQHITDMGEAQFLIDVDDAARRMAGAVQDVESEIADSDLLAFLEIAVGIEVADPEHAKTRSAL